MDHSREKIWAVFILLPFCLTQKVGKFDWRIVTVIRKKSCQARVKVLGKFKLSVQGWREGLVVKSA